MDKVSDATGNDQLNRISTGDLQLYKDLVPIWGGVFVFDVKLPRSYVFPQVQEEERNHDSIPGFANGGNGKKHEVEEKTVWVEGLVPGIDFCNHDLKAAATWEVDETGSVTGVPLSMYNLSIL
ncbi:hypothetical protein LXL04_034448 [Taraxacum kok-saghyz]